MRSGRLVPCLLVILSTWLPIQGCGKSRHSEESKVSIHPPSAAQPISPEELQRYASDLEDALNSHSVRSAIALVDWDEIVRRAVIGLPTPDRCHRELVEALVGVTRRNQGVLGELIANTTNGARVVVHRAYCDDNETGVWFKFSSADVEVHFEAQLVRSSDGIVRAGDLFMTTLGEPMSSRVRLLALEWFEKERIAVDGLSRQELQLMSNLHLIRGMRAMAAEGDFSHAMATLRYLPEEVRRIKSLAIESLYWSAQISEAEKSAATDELIRWHGNDESMAAVLLNCFAERRDYDQALIQIHRLEQIVGPDPELQMYQVHCLLKNGRFDEAERVGESALQIAPDHETLHLALIKVVALQRKYDRVVSLLTILQEKFHVSIRLAERPEFADFLRSPQYEEWNRAQQTARQPDSEHSASPRQL